jgi:hypothetical protein
MKDNPGNLIGTLVCCIWPLTTLAVGYTLGWRRWTPSLLNKIAQWSQRWDR